MTRDEFIKKIRKNVPENSAIVGCDIFYSSFLGLCFNDYSFFDPYYKSSIRKLLTIRFCSEDTEIQATNLLSENNNDNLQIPEGS